MVPHSVLRVVLTLNICELFWSSNIWFAKFWSCGLSVIFSNVSAGCFCLQVLSFPIFIRVQNSIVSRIVILWNALEFFWPLYFHIFDCTYMCWSIRWWEVLTFLNTFPITHVQSIPSNLSVTIQVLKFHIFLQINCDICCSWKLLQWEICPRSFVWLCGRPNKG